MKRLVVATLIMLASITLASWTAVADTFPSRNITIVVPFAAGSGSDTAARIIGQHLGPALGTNVVIENKVGATGALASSAVARAAPDGYTLILATNSTHGSNPSLFKKLAYDPVKDFAPVARLAIFTYYLVVNPNVPAKTPAELVAYAKANPEKLTYGAGSSTSLVMAETFKRGAGISVLKVPYKSNPPALTDLVSGQISMMFSDISSCIAFVKAGTLRALAITSPQRSTLDPGVPTIRETVLADFDILSLTGILAPAGTPDEIVTRLNKEIRRILEKPDVRERLAQLGAEPQPNSPEEFKTFVAAEIEKWTHLVKAAGIEAE